MSVPDELIAEVLDAATYVPSAENKQPWEFVVVRDARASPRSASSRCRAWEGRGRDFSRNRLSPKLFVEVDRGATGGIAAAPVLIVVAADTERGLPVTVPASIFPAIQNLLLAANALGLGSALTTITTGFADELRAAVDLPESVVPVAVIPLGFPERRLGPRLAAIRSAPDTHRDRYGEPW